MAKAFAYLCRQCCCIDGFREFGEFGPTKHITGHIGDGFYESPLKHSVSKQSNMSEI